MTSVRAELLKQIIVYKIMLRINTKSAELVGILLGDGSLGIYESEKYSTYYAVKISFDSREQDYTKYVKNLLIETLNEKPIQKKCKDSNGLDLFIFKKDIVLMLLKFGLKKAPKWERANIPSVFLNKKYGRYILRGYCDTDGTVALTNNNGYLYPRVEMKVSPSPMQKQLLYLLGLYSFHYGAYQIGKGKIRIQLNGRKLLQKWKKEIGFSNIKHKKKADLAFRVKKFSELQNNLNNPKPNTSK